MSHTIRMIVKGVPKCSQKRQSSLAAVPTFRLTRFMMSLAAQKNIVQCLAVVAVLVIVVVACVAIVVSSLTTSLTLPIVGLSLLS
jgi:hypothetical protein